jgi:hypothetical protein
MWRRVTTAALAVALLYFPSLRYDILLDGAETEFYGFPLVWNARSLVTSMGKEIYLIPLIIDASFYTLVAWLILRAWRAYAPRSWDRAAAALVCLWSGFLLATILLYLVVTFRDHFFQAWYYLDWYGVKQVSLSRGY